MKSAILATAPALLLVPAAYAQCAGGLNGEGRVDRFDLGTLLANRG